MLLAQHNYSFYYIWFRQKCKPCDIPISNHFSHQRLQSICCVSQQSLESATSVYCDAELQLKLLFLLSRFMAAFFLHVEWQMKLSRKLCCAAFCYFPQKFHYIWNRNKVKWQFLMRYIRFSCFMLCKLKKKRDEKKEIKSGNMTK